MALSLLSVLSLVGLMVWLLVRTWKASRRRVAVQERLHALDRDPPPSPISVEGRSRLRPPGRGIETIAMIVLPVAVWLLPYQRDAAFWRVAVLASTGGLAIALTTLAWSIHRRQARGRVESVWRLAGSCAAGSSLESALGALVRDRDPADRPFKREAWRYLQESRMGVSRSEALAALERRLRSPEWTRVSIALRQSGSRPSELAATLAAGALELERQASRADRSGMLAGAIAVACLALVPLLAIAWAP
jgi:pilus assembly protein TadC